MGVFPQNIMNTSPAFYFRRPRHPWRLPVAAAFLATLLTAGCATPPPAPEIEAPVYPPPPAEPRFVFERTLRYSENVQAVSAANKLKYFATGATDELNGLVKPYDVAAFQGRIYVTDTVQRVVILFDIPGNRYLEFGLDTPGALVKPVGIDVSADGREVYVADVSAQRVMVYTNEGVFLRSIGDKSLLHRPTDVAVDSARNRVYIVDTGGVENQDHRIQVFDTAGTQLRTLGQRGPAPGQFNLPLQATVAPDGTLYVVDSGNFRVQSFAPDGTFHSTFGTLGRYPGQFAKPKGIAADPDGNLYVVDTAFGNFQIFSPDGQLLLFVGQRGQSSKPGSYMLPAGIDVDASGRIYVVDQFFRKLDIYRPASLPENSPFAPSP
jgi:DNA-binding beta-propeller fold protein YncE